MGVRHLPVVDNEYKPIGMITRHDLAHLQVHEHAYESQIRYKQWDAEKRRFNRPRMRTGTMGEILNSPGALNVPEEIPAKTLPVLKRFVLFAFNCSP
jgi:predicted transcriptional regulator